ncbi:MAG TPA: hypothetical protein VM511_08165 [Luteolibacter sp.]|nr:hypothetical protein [Luteolibacter sp.]
MTDDQTQSEEAPSSNQPQPFPPRAICIAGALMISFGVNSLVEMVAAWIGGSLSFNIGFVGIIIGGGILIGRSSSRTWALLFSSLGLLQCLIATGIVIYRHISGKQPSHHPDGAYAAIELSLFAACSIYVLIVLSRKEYRAWFDTVKTAGEPVKNFASAVAVIVAVFAISRSADNWWIENTFERIHPVQVTLIPYDSVSGKGINTSLSYSRDAFEKSGRSFKSQLPRIIVTFMSRQDGMLMGLSGVATHPFEFEIISEGYHNTAITIDPSSKDEIRVPLQPLHITVEPERP